MFQYIRVQLLHPCRAKCQWCSTHKKNPLFQKLQETGVASTIHEEYIRLIKHFKPKEVFISGGEPLLDPEIASFLDSIKDSTQQINVFTSYQYSKGVRARVPFDEMPLDKICLHHTPIYFEPDRWHKLTKGFPFDVYLENIKAVVDVPVRKRFKFILNHALFEDEVRRFQELVQPNETCEVSLKVMNDQGANEVVDPILKSRDRALSRLSKLDNVLDDAGWKKVSRPLGSADQMLPVLKGGTEVCPYRQEKPIELRFSLHRADTGRQVLRYRFCPYFPGDFYHKFHVGRDTPESIVKAWKKGPFRDHCHKCRFLNYKISDDDLVAGDNTAASMSTHDSAVVKVTQ